MNHLKKIFYLLKSKKIWKLPEQKEILILDEEGSKKIEGCLLGHSNYNILFDKYKKINILILLFGIFYFWKYGKYFYEVSFIKFAKPKIAITFLDTSYYYGNILKFIPTCKLMLIQNGRIGSYRIDLLKNLKNKIDYYAVNGELQINFFNKYMKSNFINAGSLLGNEIDKPKFNKIKKIQWISQYRSGNSSFMNFNRQILTRKDSLDIPDRVIANVLCEFCKNNSLKLEVIKFLDKEEETEYYEKIFRELNFRNFFIIESSRKIDYLQSYSSISDDSLIVGADSQLIFELFGIGFRTAIFTIRGFYMKDESREFYWPNNHKEKDFFWTNIPNNSYMREILNNIYNVTENEWNFERNKYSALMSYSYKNKAIKNILIKEGIKIN